MFIAVLVNRRWEKNYFILCLPHLVLRSVQGGGACLRARRRCSWRWQRKPIVCAHCLGKCSCGCLVRSSSCGRATAFLLQICSPLSRSAQVMHLDRERPLLQFRCGPEVCLLVLVLVALAAFLPFCAWDLVWQVERNYIRTSTVWTWAHNTLLFCDKAPQCCLQNYITSKMSSRCPYVSLHGACSCDSKGKKKVNARHLSVLQKGLKD